jgi:predicted amino acid-binding ACT domain protein
MAFRIRRVEYFTTTVQDQPGEAYKLLSQLANLGLNLLAFTAVPVGPLHAQLTIFPEDPLRMADAARKAGLVLDGPHPAFLVQGDDELGALARLHAKLYEANVNVYASSGVADGLGSFGYVVYIRPDDYERAAAALGV